MFSTHGNMAFHQGDINEAAINFHINIKYMLILTGFLPSITAEFIYLL